MNKKCSYCDEDKSLTAHKGTDGTIYVCPTCINKSNEEEIFRHEKSHVKILKPIEIKEQLDKVVIGQEHAKKVLSTEIHKHYIKILNKDKLIKMGKSIKKTNILLTGLSGTGKTLIAKTLASIVGVPFSIGDATSLTEAGYVGEDVENLLLGLIRASNEDISLAEKGIIFIDEIDKIAKKSENQSLTRDVSGEGVQQSLLKLVEGQTVRVPVGGGRKHPGMPMHEINTENILFIAGGAFTGIEEIVRERLKDDSSKIGFNAKVTSKTQGKIPLKKLRQSITTADLKKFGLIDEFLGRFPVVSHLAPLELNDLIKILNESQDSILNEHQLLFELQGKSLRFTDEAIEQIAKIAIDKGIGARGLQAIVEETMLDISFNMPSSPQKDYLITKEMILYSDEILDEKIA